MTRDLVLLPRDYNLPSVPSYFVLFQNYRDYENYHHLYKYEPGVAFPSLQKLWDDMRARFRGVEVIDIAVQPEQIVMQDLDVYNCAGVYIRCSSNMMSHEQQGR